MKCLQATVTDAIAGALRFLPQYFSRVDKTEQLGASQFR